MRSAELPPRCGHDAPVAPHERRDGIGDVEAMPNGGALERLGLGGTRARAPRHAARAAERQSDVEDRSAMDLGIAGYAGERWIGAEFAHGKVLIGRDGSAARDATSAP